jgi:hypothetical protein
VTGPAGVTPPAAYKGVVERSPDLLREQVLAVYDDHELREIVCISDDVGERLGFRPPGPRRLDPDLTEQPEGWYRNATRIHLSP